MNWALDSLVSMIAAGFYNFFLTLSSDNYESSSIVSIILITTGLWFYFKSHPFSNFLKYTEIWSIISGIFFGLTAYFVSESIKRVSNPGVPIQLVTLNTLLAYFGGILIFKQKFNWNKFYPMLIILLGSITTILPELNNFRGKAGHFQWIIYIFFALLFAALGDLTTKLSLNKINNNQYQIISMLVAGFSVLIIELVQTKSIGLKKLPKNKIKKKSVIKILDEKPIISIVLATISMILFREYYGKGILKASNPGFPRSIINADFVPLTILSRFFIKNSRITSFQYIGGFICLIGLALSAKNS